MIRCKTLYTQTTSSVNWGKKDVATREGNYLYFCRSGSIRRRLKHNNQLLMDLSAELYEGDRLY